MSRNFDHAHWDKADIEYFVFSIPKPAYPEVVPGEEERYLHMFHVEHSGDGASGSGFMLSRHIH